MTLEEARMVWLLRVGSGWMDESTPLTQDNQIWEAFLRLSSDSSFETNPNTQALRIK